MLERLILSDPKYYSISLESLQDTLILFAISSKIQIFNNFYSIHYLLTHANIEPILEFDNNNCLTFKSEILINNNAYSCYKGNRDNENNNIEQTLKSKLGDTYKITISELK